VSELLKKGDLITVWASGSRTSVGNFTRGVVEERTSWVTFKWHIIGGSILVQGLCSREGIAWIRGHGSEAEQALDASRRLLLPEWPTSAPSRTAKSKRTRR
jgi:hypothetical protein